MLATRVCCTSRAEHQARDGYSDRTQGDGDGQQVRSAGLFSNLLCSTRHAVDEDVPSFFVTTATDTRGNVGNSALRSSTWAPETAVKYRLREYTAPVSPPVAFKRATSILILDFDQSGRNCAIPLVVFPCAIQPRTTSTSCGFREVSRPIPVAANIEGNCVVQKIQGATASARTWCDEKVSNNHSSKATSTGEAPCTKTNVENCDAHLLQHQLPPSGIQQDLLCHHLCRCSRENYIHTLTGTLRIVKGVTVLPQRVARSSRAPSSNTLLLSTFPADKMIATDTDTQKETM